MFRVEKNTVALIFQAQRNGLRGKLRLDISSRRLPGDPLQAVHDEAAREALAERLLRTLKSAANDAVLLAQKSGWQVANPPPAPDAHNRIRVTTAANHFESYLTSRLDEVLGLNRNSEKYRSALAHLAKDLFRWVSDKTAEAEAHHLERHENQLFVRCLPCKYPQAPLPEGRVVAHGPVGRSSDSSRP